MVGNPPLSRYYYKGACVQLHSIESLDVELSSAFNFPVFSQMTVY